jgi:hypothetical protein
MKILGQIFSSDNGRQFSLLVLGKESLTEPKNPPKESLSPVADRIGLDARILGDERNCATRDTWT